MDVLVIELHVIVDTIQDVASIDALLECINERLLPQYSEHTTPRVIEGTSSASDSMTLTNMLDTLANLRHGIDLTYPIWDCATR